MHAIADLSHLPPAQDRRGLPPQTLANELRGVIENAITGAPRSRQKAIGPSEIGHPCSRRIGYRLLDVEKTNDTPGWRPTVGTAVHAWLAETFIMNEQARSGGDPSVPRRWLVEHRVDIGDDVHGSCDLVDRETATLIDWKVVAATTLRSARIDGPSEQYRIQVHAYARGWHRRGVNIDTVGIYYLPSSGELHEGHLWTEPYDEDIATAALHRLGEIRALTGAFGTKALPALRTETPERLCRYCPWNLPASTDLAVACPGPDKATSALAS